MRPRTHITPEDGRVHFPDGMALTRDGVKIPVTVVSRLIDCVDQTHGFRRIIFFEEKGTARRYFVADLSRDTTRPLHRDERACINNTRPVVAGGTRGPSQHPQREDRRGDRAACDVRMAVDG